MDHTSSEHFVFAYVENLVPKVKIQHFIDYTRLDICTLFYANNQTIGLSTGFTVRLIKVINVTKPLKRNDITYYDGRWAPFLTNADILSDESFFADKGEYLRYSSKQTTVNIQFEEEVYFVQNNQSPIIRRGALFFHTVLFIFSLIEIFAMISLLYKLWFHPIRRHIIKAHNDLLVDEFQSSQTHISIDVSSFFCHGNLSSHQHNSNS